MLALKVLLLSAPQSTWYVDASAAAPGSGTLAAPYSRVDYAVAQATTVSGDSLQIAAGTYPAESIDLASKFLTFEAAPGATPVIRGVDGESTLVAGPGSRLTARGLRFDGAQASGGLVEGGAIHAEGSNVLLEDCSFANWFAGWGGAVHFVGGALDRDLVLTRVTVEPTCRVDYQGGAIRARDASVSITDSDLMASSTYYTGGVLYLENCLAEISDTPLTGTAYESGGCIYADGGSTTLTNCTVTGQSREDYFGGGVAVEGGNLSIHGCAFWDCVAITGGAIYCVASTQVHIAESAFVNNRTDTFVTMSSGSGGGAIYCSGTGTVENCVFMGNRSIHGAFSKGGAIVGGLSIFSSTFVNNQGSIDAEACVLSPAATMSGCIVVNPIGSSLPHVSGSAGIQYSVSDQVLPGGTNVQADPSFWSLDTLRLLPDSPAIDLLPASFGLDADGTPLDAGAFPFDPQYCGPGCDGPLGNVGCVAVPNSTGQASIISAFGSTVIANDRLVINVEELPTGSRGYFIASQTADFVPGAGGSSGAFCVGGSVLRFSRTVLTATPLGRSVSFRPRLGDLPGGNAVSAGDLWYFQLWHRDASPSGPTSNFSPSLGVQF